MKKYLMTTRLMKVFRQLIIIPVLINLLLISNGLFAQGDTTKPKEASVDTTKIHLSPSLEFTTVQKSDNSIDLKAALKAKFNGNFVRLPELKVIFKQITDAAEKDLGFLITDGRGNAVLNYKGDSLKGDKEGKIHLKAVFAGNKSMDPADGEVFIKRARLEITPVKHDSLLSVQLKLVDLSTGQEKPVPQTDLNVYVKRSFFPLKLGEGKTDEAGSISVDIPNNLPGDASGNITLLGRLDESETYGMLEATTTPQKWGVAVSTNINVNERALWSTHPPIWMLITFVVLMTAVWGHYIVIVFKLFRLRKEEPQELSKATNV